MNKKLLLSSAIAAALGLGSVSVASADVVNLDDGTGVDTYAQEINPVNGEFTLTNNTATPPATPTQALSLTAVLGFSITAGDSRFIRIDLSDNVTFDEVFNSGDFSLTPSDVIDIAVSAGGDGQSFIVLEVANQGTTAIDNDAVWAWDVPGVVASDQASNSVRYRLFDDPSEAINEASTASLKDTGETEYFNWGTGVAGSCEPAEAPVIDVVDRVNWLGEDAPVPQPLLTLTPEVFGVLGDESTPVAWEDFFPAGGTELILTGSAGFEDGFATAPGAVQVDSDAIFTMDFEDTTGTPVPRFQFDVPVWTEPQNGDAATLNLLNNGEVEMTASTYSVTLRQAADSSPTYEIDPISQDCGRTLFSGSSDRLDFATGDDGFFNTWFRVVNPSEIDGTVTITLINDDGVEVTFDLGELANNTDPFDQSITSTLASGASTAVIPVEQLLEAGRRVAPNDNNPDNDNFDLAATGPGSSNKLRIIARGTFGDDATDGTGSGTVDGSTVSFRGAETLDRRTDGIVIQGFTASRDSNSFFPIQN